MTTEATASVSVPPRTRQASTPGGQPPRFARYHSTGGRHPFDLVDWETRDAVIIGPDGEPVFEQKGVEVPAFWSQTATNVVANKYFRGRLGTPQRESSVRQLIGRVADTIAGWGRADHYFAGAGEAAIFGAELTHLLVHQMACFNSPVWFNVGVEERPQCSACFINSVDDTLESIFGLARTEGMLFKYGSGAGSNLSSLRSSRESLSSGGTSSGPVAFMRGYDAFAGVVKSGGKTRRAAKMVILNDDHPDIVEFITSKQVEESKARALIREGYDAGFAVPGGAYDSVAFQNANHSVRVSDEFMRAAMEDGDWITREVTTGEPVEKLKARGLLERIAESTWVCGDPGLQFDSTINDWHTCPKSGRINASNPCSEYLFLDDSACNLASINLLKFLDSRGDLEVDGFRHACEVMITAQEILVGNASYPTKAIEVNSHDYRPLGLGFANLGALLMARGLPYDSEAGRDYAATVTALMTGAAYAQSARLAERIGPFTGFEPNREPMTRVIGKHREALAGIDPENVPADLLAAAGAAWGEALEGGAQSGWRNSQVSAIAPTGTIGFMMDCDTTGIEPDIALVKYKTLTGGGMIKMVNRTVPRALARLGYSDEERQAILAHIERRGTIEGAPDVEPDHLAVFDCAFRPVEGSRTIHSRGHLKMLAAVQPFVSGAISKTVNMPEEATVEEIFDAYVDSWRLGLKAVAIYRDGSKKTQPLSTRNGTESSSDPASIEDRAAEPIRRRLADERQAITHKFTVNGHKGYLTVGLYEDGGPGEIFIVMAKEGSTISGLMDVLATSVSIALQHGVPLATLVNKFAHTRFEPAGFTGNPEIPIAKSVIDYIFRYLATKFLSREEQAELGIVLRGPDASENQMSAAAAAPGESALAFVHQQDSPSCADCGSIMVRNGTCYHCPNCGATSGCG